jgi:ubiquinone/menaquinone biosynthesis C-methylase UbiE
MAVPPHETTPFTPEEIAANRCRQFERNELFRAHGYDFDASHAAILSLALPLAGEVLEIGSGKGRFLAALLPHVTRVESVDISRDEQRFARLNTAAAGHGEKARFILADALRLPWPPRTFDAVVSVNALHHLEAPDAMLAELLRVIKPSGKIVLADFNESGYAIVGRVHAAEGRVHERCVVSFPRVQEVLAEAGWNARIHDAAHQIMLIAEPAAA